MSMLKIKDFSDTNWLSLTIYNGFHPSFFHEEYNLKLCDAEKVKGMFLQKNIKWLYFQYASSQFYLKEQKIAGNKIEKGLIVHIAMSSNQTNSIDELTKIVEKIKLMN